MLVKRWKSELVIGVWYCVVSVSRGEGGVVMIQQMAEETLLTQVSIPISYYIKTC